MFARRLLLSIGLLAAASGVALGAPHAVTYSQRVGQLGVNFDVNGRPYKLVKVPFKAFDGGKYAVILPIPKLDGSEGSIRTVHSNKPFTSNTTISGFPAYISIQDVREYQVAGAIGNSAALDVVAIAEAVATVQVGTTLVSVRVYQHHDVGEIGLPQHRFHEMFLEVDDAVDLVPFADWATWRDLKPEAAAVDTLLDYIQVIPL
jgi:hypothetical protein